MSEDTQPAQAQETPSASPSYGADFFHQRGWIFLGLAMVVVGSWPGWLPLLMPKESASYIQALLPASVPAAVQKDDTTQARLSLLESHLRDIEARPLQGTSAPTDLGHEVASASLRALSWMSLRTKLMAGQPFAEEAVLLTSLVDGQARQDLVALEAFAPKGVPSLDDLRKSLDALLSDQKTQAEEEKTMAQRSVFERAWHSFLGALKSLVRVTTDSPQSISGAPLAATKTMLEKSDLTGALALWDAFTARNKAPLPPKMLQWYDAAKTRAHVTLILPRIDGHMVDLPQLDRIATLMKKENAGAS
ncbi:MAG: hypothetical protein C0514_05465 [Candidatus Puniceispirillum sp.]|nr:hypothetical protein [Candidatus Puniceispirillum sp.]